MKGT
ncbi:hypothetical protein HNY73_011620, partial [Argiope bruennichi]|jgi:hypothetical protein